MFDNLELDQLFEKVEKLRNIIKNNQKMMDYYYYLKDINKGDNLYGWMFSNNGILSDQPEDLNFYQAAYIRDILIIYKNELENIITKNH